MEICMRVFGVLLMSIVGCAAQEQELSFPAKILVIRHAEKPPDADPSADLSAIGKKRAEELPRLFTKSETRPDPFPKPDFIFAAKNSKHSHRSLETVAPLARKLRVDVNSEFRSEDFGMLANELLQNPKYQGKTILICWRHAEMPALAMALKAKNGVPEKVKSSAFDRVWEITYAKGKAVFLDRPQQLLPGDSER
jgi:hypothetical protein